MALKHQWLTKSQVRQGLLQWVNLRPEESQRTFLMFAFYTATSVGLLWLEASTVALFLGEYGANFLPWIYIASAGIGSGLGVLYSWMQKFLPLRWVIVAIALLMAAPLILFRLGLNIIYLAGATVFLMRLWLEAIYVLNELNTSITANQLFNIREIKRTYPLISSGVLVADVVSGFSLPLLLRWVGLPNVIIMACFVMIVGAAILLYLSQNYQQSFPDAPRRRLDRQSEETSTGRLRGPLRRYGMPLLAFFAISQILFLLVDFQYLSQLEIVFQSEDIASFLGLFNGILGIFELATQWFISSRAIERLGVFTAAMILPTILASLGSLAFLNFLVGLVILKFLDELLRYTLLASISPVLFQPLPDTIRGNIQAGIRGIAEPLATGLTGVGLLAILWLFRRSGFSQAPHWFFVVVIIVLALTWLLAIGLLQSRYVGLLVLSAERGQLSASDMDLRALKRAVVEALERPETEAYKRSCIELLSQIDPQNVGEVLAPLLPNLPSTLQGQSLEAMLLYPNPTYLNQVRSLINQPLPPDVLAVALRYIWLTDPEPDIDQLQPYLRPGLDPVVRGTAAALILRRGDRKQKAEATNTLRQMLTHKRERERVMGCRALGDAIYMQALRLYIPNLLQDESLRVRCALLEAIAATHLEEYYPSLLRGLYYKSTREAAMNALIRLENEALPMLLELAADIHKPDLVRMHAWSAIAQIGTLEALNILVDYLQTSWGASRRNILYTLLKSPQDAGIDAVLDRLSRRGVEQFIDQELMFIGQTYAALLDLTPERIRGREAELLRRALRDMQADAVERLFLLMKFLYPLSAIQAAAFNLQSRSQANIARGLEILDNTLDIPNKRAFLSILDGRSDLEKLQSLGELVSYQPMTPSARLRRLLELRHFLSDWGLACCFHLARQARWSLTAEQTLACLRHPTGFVREAVLSYLKVASPRALLELLPLLKNDPNPLVAAQVEQMMKELSQVKSKASVLKATDNIADFLAGLEPI